jgi:predicted MFS family arabinose efflux permease
MVGAATLGHAAISRLDDLLGGAGRRRVIVALAAVLALDSADKSTIGTSATQLQAGLGIDKTQIGLLLSVSSLVGAFAAIPFGILVDRTRRIRLLSITVLCWAVAMVLSGIATSFEFLMLARIALGVVVAVAGPAIASLVGDYFPQQERGRIYGFVLSGELIGAGFGFVVAGQFALLSWRAPFFVLVLPSLLVWWLLRRLPEPARGGASRLREGAREVPDADEAAAHPATVDEDEPGSAESATLAHEAVRDSDVEPREAAVLEHAPAELSLWQTVRYVLRVRTNVVLIVASALGYFFFSGLRGFAIEFAKDHYRVSHSVATTLTLALGVGALAGVLVGGRLADRLLRSGRVPARVEVPGVAVLAAAGLFVPAIVTTSVGVALPLLILAALCLGAANPPLDAARLDIIVPGVWGRAEAVRTFFRNCGDAAAPLLFGVLADAVFGGKDGLEYTFLVMLISLVAASVISLTVARRTYPSDVAAAAESQRRLRAARRN